MVGHLEHLGIDVVIAHGPVLHPRGGVPHEKEVLAPVGDLEHYAGAVGVVRLAVGAQHLDGEVVRQVQVLTLIQRIPGEHRASLLLHRLQEIGVGGSVLIEAGVDHQVDVHGAQHVIGRAAMVGVGMAHHQGVQVGDVVGCQV